LVDFPIPANDDATKSISLILDQICNAIQEGLEDRKNLKEKDKEDSSKEAAVEAVVEVAPVVDAAPVVEETPEAPAAEEKSAE
jgi:small subunit ribosomal protein S2